MDLVFKTEKISEHITRIFAFNTELMYLVEGEQRAALLDSGSGFGSLRACVDGLTDKPVTVLLTHGHTDHALGAAEFEDVYINPLEKPTYATHSDLNFRKRSGEMWPEFRFVTEEQIIPALPFDAMKPLHPGDRFDLGGVSVEAYACPGHTLGSLVFLIPEERTILLGDACNYMTFLFDETTTSVEDYRNALLRLKEETAGKFDTVLLSHGDGWGVPDMIQRVAAVCDDVLAGNSDEQPFEFMGFHNLAAKATGPDRMRLDGGAGNIVYRKDHIR
ncbi:MAG: MBL fold metallo-hydrolase [Oscillospiraceae bacterium]